MSSASESSDDIQPFYQVQKVVNKRSDGLGSYQYFVKWKGFVKKTWEPISNLSEIAELIYQYEENQKNKRKKGGRQHETNKNQNICKPYQNKSKSIGKTRLKKMSDKAKDNKYKPMDVESDIYSINKSTEELILDEPKQKQEQTSKSQPRSFVIREDDIPEPPEKIGPIRTRKPNIYMSEIDRIKQIQRMDGKWKVLVQFKQDYFPDQWYQRDIIRVLHPMQLLLLYERLAKERE